MIVYDCGLSEREHANWQAWLDIYDLIIKLYDSVSDINQFVNGISKDSPYNTYGMSDAGDEIYALFNPVLALIQKANDELREHYNLQEIAKEQPSYRPDISR